MQKSLIRKLKMNYDKTATTFKSKSLEEYPIHVTFINFSLQPIRFLIDHGYKLVGLIQVGFQGIDFDHD